MKLILVFFVASNRRVIPVNLAQTRQCRNDLCPLHNLHNCYKKKNTTVKKTTKIESLETLRKINNSAQKIKNSYLRNFSSFLGFMT